MLPPVLSLFCCRVVPPASAFARTAVPASRSVMPLSPCFSSNNSESPTEVSFRADDVLKFWFESCRPDQWFASAGEEAALFDETIRSKFSDWTAAANEGRLDFWQRTAPGSLALVLLMDQFNRNLYRNTAAMYQSDARCQELVLESLQHGHDKELADEKCKLPGRPEDRLLFLFLPLMHAESLELQDLLLSKMDEYGMDKKFAIVHRNDIERFGRFPSRNVVLGRASTPEEAEYVNSPEAWFNQNH